MEKELFLITGWSTLKIGPHRPYVIKLGEEEDLSTLWNISKRNARTNPSAVVGYHEHYRLTINNRLLAYQKGVTTSPRILDRIQDYTDIIKGIR